MKNNENKSYDIDILNLAKGKKLVSQPKNTQFPHPFHKDLCLGSLIKLLPVTRCSQENISVHAHFFVIAVTGKHGTSGIGSNILSLPYFSLRRTGYQSGIVFHIFCPDLMSGGIAPG